MMRLETVATELARKLRQANSDRLRAASLLACELAIKAAQVENHNVLDALTLLRKQGALPSLKRTELDDLAATLDESYFDLQDRAENDPALVPESLRFFGQARAVSALSFAGGEDALIAAMESIYEASASVDDGSRIYDAVLSVVSR